MSPRKELLPGEGICGGLTSLPLAAGVYLKGILVFAMSNFCFSGNFKWCLVFAAILYYSRYASFGSICLKGCDFAYSGLNDFRIFYMLQENKLEKWPSNGIFESFSRGLHTYMLPGYPIRLLWCSYY